MVLQTLAPIDLRQAPKKKELSGFLKVITSPLLTIGLAATLATLLNPAAGLAVAKGAGRLLIPKTAKGAIVAAITIPTAIGVLSSSKKARSIAKKLVDPRENIKKGKKIAELIEDPGKAKDILGIKESSTFKDKIVKGLKVAGLAGAAAAVIVGGKAALEKGSQILKERAAKKAATEISSKAELRELGFTAPQPVGLGGIPVAAPQKALTGARTGEISKPPIQNIIQIQVQ